MSNTMEKVRDNDGRWDDGYGSTYEARVVIGTYAKMNSKPGQFEGVHWARHGNGFGKYWTQERNNASCEIMTHANGVGYNVACPQVATVIVYVKIDSPQMDQYKLDFFSSIGGQTHVRCSCTGFPLIISGAYRKDKRKCMQSTCVWEERLICSNNACTVYAESVLKVSQFPASLLSIHHWERIQAQLVMII